MTANVLIGIAGGKQVGKTTLANLLAEKYRLRHVSFAEPIRSFVAHMLGATDAELESHKETPIAWLDGITPRRMMQSLGTELGRQLWHQEIWVRFAMRKAVSEGRAVISDVRFPNEAEAIRHHGGKVIRLHRITGLPADSHASEKPLDDSLIDCEIQNSASPADMLNSAEQYLFGPDGVLNARTVVIVPKLGIDIPKTGTDAEIDAMLPPGTPPAAMSDG